MGCIYEIISWNSFLCGYSKMVFLRNTFRLKASQFGTACHVVCTLIQMHRQCQRVGAGVELSA